ncbi:MAG: NACHT domain-containing protein [Myxococcales bacterium]|nr:NACHT domain-containing protein [Myxococcales bacterium]
MAEWLGAGCVAEGKGARDRISAAIGRVIATDNVSPDQVRVASEQVIATIENQLMANAAIAAWRHKVSLDYLSGQVADLRRLAERASGVISEGRKEDVLRRYMSLMLRACDIIDLANLPVEDVQLGTQALLLRQLYMPLRVELERDSDEALDADFLQEDEEHLEEKVVSVGNAVNQRRRIVVLGEPGGGKTTMLRWMATAYLLRMKNDPAIDMLPDVEGLPSVEWLPVLIRCRDLGDADLCRSFQDFLAQHLRKSELFPDEADIMLSLVMERLATGKALLLIDGLDEISNSSVRVQFCQELERTAVRYPAAAVVATSRIVGYRDMPYRMGSDFAHGVLAELREVDKIVFSKRWVDVTEAQYPSAERLKRASELIDSILESERISRLAGNPMLLTTLALVKRKVGKLPTRRVRLYAEAVSVLLNWNRRAYAVIEEEEAIPQLEYLAWDMCKRGVQRIHQDDLLASLEGCRRDLAKLRAIHRRSPEEFLTALEARSSLLVRTGFDWSRPKGEDADVWEFRHLTFQEYLASRAMLDGRYPTRERGKPLAEQVAALSGLLDAPPAVDSDPSVPEVWQEAIRLLVSDCLDDDVDEVLEGILSTGESEVDVAGTSRSRAVLAARCLADEPNVGEDVARRVLSQLASVVMDIDCTRAGNPRSKLDVAVFELAKSSWGDALRAEMLRRYMAGERVKYGGIAASVGYLMNKKDAAAFAAWQDGLLVKMGEDSDEWSCVEGALGASVLAYHNELREPERFAAVLLSLMGRGERSLFAASWALCWAVRNYEPDVRGVVESHVDVLLGSFSALARLGVHSERSRLAAWLLGCVGGVLDERIAQVALTFLGDEVLEVRKAAYAVKGLVAHDSCVSRVVLALAGESEAVRRALRSVVLALPLEREEVLALYRGLLEEEGLCVAVAGRMYQHGVLEGEVALRRWILAGGARGRDALGVWIQRRPVEERIAVSYDLDGKPPWVSMSLWGDLGRVASVAAHLGVSESDLSAMLTSLAGLVAEGLVGD